MGRISKILTSRAAFTGIIAFIIVSALIVRINVACKHRVPAGDEGAWLRIASKVPSSDFMTSRVIEHDLYSERELPHPEDNRSPLYPVLTAFCTNFISDPLWAGQALNIAIFLILAMFLAIYMKNNFGRIAAVSSLIFICCSPFLIKYSVSIYPDLLIALIFLLFLLNIKRITASPSCSVAGGICLGLFFLLKSTAVFLLIPFSIEFIRQRKKKAVFKKTALFFMLFILVSLPWLIRNYVIFGSFLHQAAGYTLYMDSWSGFFNTGMETPGLMSYLHNKGIIHLFIIRPFAGFYKMVIKFPWFDHYLSLALLPFSAAGIFYLKSRHRYFRHILIFSFFYLIFMGYIAYNSWVARYTMVYYVILYALAGVGINYLASLIRKDALRYIAILIFTVSPLFTVMYPLEFYLSPRGSEKQMDITYRKIINKTKQSVPDSSVILSSFLSQYCFMHDFYVVNALNFKDGADLEKFIDIYGTGYMLLKKEGKLFKISRNMKDYYVSEIFEENGIVLERVGVGK